jgi:hypothetical protein
MSDTKINSKQKKLTETIQSFHMTQKLPVNNGIRFVHATF